MNRVLTLEHVSNYTGLSPATIWRLRKDGDFPIAKQLGMRRVGFLESDIEEWIENRPEVQLCRTEQASSNKEAA